jgi:hypothetical protein
MFWRNKLLPFFRVDMRKVGEVASYEEIRKKETRYG